MKTGQLIGGKYRLVTLVGEGGMGAVWHAMHMQLGHDVAVKFLTHPGANSEVLLNRFFDEARTAASVRHRNVIDILDFGISDEGRPYMVMEFMEGESLAARLERGPALTLPEVTLTVALSLGGLAAVHDRGIIHRDLKPDNIFLTYDADGSFPKILDFGVSKDLGRDTVGERSVQTRDGVLLGTPQYMSPEQARGLKDIDHRTDLYSMGVILYEVLAGVRPFESENVGDILMMVMSG
jgi:serine/threonine protein kinase